MAARRRVLVTGGNGLLGSRLLRLLLARPELEVASTSRGPCANAELGPFEYFPLDVADPASVEAVIDAARPDVVIHTAAMTDVDGCERDPLTCWRVNAEGTERLARACGRRNARLVHLSTEYVFDGLSGPYGEDDPVNPLSQYGRSKLAGELAAREHCRSWAVARTTVLYGADGGRRRNFVLWLLGELRAGRAVRVVNDQVGSPTLADNLAEMVAALALSDERGVFHTAGASVMDRYSFACLAAEVFELPKDLVRPVSTAELCQDAPRPLKGGLRVDKFRRTFPHVQVLEARQGLQRLRAQLRP